LTKAYAEATPFYGKKMFKKGTLDTSSDSWVASAQCSKGAKQPKRQSWKKKRDLPLQRLEYKEDWG